MGPWGIVAYHRRLHAGEGELRRVDVPGGQRHAIHRDHRRRPCNKQQDGRCSREEYTCIYIWVWGGGALRRGEDEEEQGNRLNRTLRCGERHMAALPPGDHPVLRVRFHLVQDLVLQKPPVQDYEPSTFFFTLGAPLIRSKKAP